MNFSGGLKASGFLIFCHPECLGLIDLAVGLGGLARLGTAAEVVLPPLQQHVLAALRGKESEFAHSDVRL